MIDLLLGHSLCVICEGRRSPRDCNCNGLGFIMTDPACCQGCGRCQEPVAPFQDGQGWPCCAKCAAVLRINHIPIECAPIDKGDPMYFGIYAPGELKRAYRAAHRKARELRRMGLERAYIAHALCWYFGLRMSDCVMVSYPEPLLAEM